MGISLELKNSSEQLNNLKPIQERVFLPPINRLAKFEDRSTVKKRIDPRYISNPRRELAKDTTRSLGTRYRESIKSNVVEDGELVKHMTNLPGYLKGVEKAVNSQDKVLNVGVLDWSRLEQWKHKHENALEKGSSSASCSSSNSFPKRSSGSSRSSNYAHTRRPSEHFSLRPSVFSSRDVEGSIKTASCFQDLATTSRSIVPEQKGVPNNLSRSHAGVIPEKEIEKGKSAELKSFGTSLHPKENSSFRHVTFNERAVGVSMEADTKIKSVDQKIYLGAEALSSNIGGYDALLHPSKSPVSVRARRSVDLANLPDQGNRIVLLLPKDSPDNNGSSEASQISRRRLSLDKTKTASRKCSFSEDIPAKDIIRAKRFPETPQSLQFPSSVDTQDISNTIRNGVTNHDSTRLPSTSFCTVSCPEKKRDLRSERECVVNRRTEDKTKNSSDKEPVEMPSQEHAELSSSNSRNPSPLRRFSFSLGRMGRSFSFKEDTVVPQLSTTQVSVKSGPVGSDASDCVDKLNNDKAKGHNRARSSPLRRFLDPILKHKEPNQTPHQPEYRLPPKLCPNSFSSGPIYSLANEKTQESRMQAVLQVKVNNGIPLFKFVVNNSSSNILAATMKSLGSSDKDDSGRSYTFYLVNEIKKKSGGWISQGSKVKNCGYAYNVVGQMKVSTSEMSDVIGHASDEYCMRESVLFSVERKAVDHGSPKFVPNRELAAAVVKIPRKDHIRDGHRSEDENVEDMWCFPEVRCSNCVSVILPGGVHGIPNKGEPSPLISRWKSGGSCDCGGWDVGCKIEVLSDQSKSAKVSKAFKDGRILDSFELFVQGDKQNGPIFSLLASKDGIYSVEYNTSLTRLQAFFICVALLSSQKVPHVSLVGDVLESKASEKRDSSPGHGLQAKFPSKYASNPPLSPVGRV